MVTGDFGKWLDIFHPEFTLYHIYEHWFYWLAFSNFTKRWLTSANLINIEHRIAWKGGWKGGRVCDLGHRLVRVQYPNDTNFALSNVKIIKTTSKVGTQHFVFVQLRWPLNMFHSDFVRRNCSILFTNCSFDSFIRSFTQLLFVCVLIFDSWK